MKRRRSAPLFVANQKLHSAFRSALWTNRRSNPGYIKGYIPGVRENGGQYTHGAIWTAMAFSALMGESERRVGTFRFAQSHNSMAGTRRNKSPPTRWKPYVICRRCLCRGSAHWSRRLDLVHRVRPAGCTDSSPKHYSASISKAIAYVSLLVFPASWTSYKIHYRHRQDRLSHHRQASSPADGTVELSLDGQKSYRGNDSPDRRPPRALLSSLQSAMKTSAPLSSRFTGRERFVGAIRKFDSRRLLLGRTCA